MGKSRLRFEYAMVVGNETKPIESFGIWVEIWISHHGSLWDSDPIFCGDASPIGERVRGQRAPYG